MATTAPPPSTLSSSPNGNKRKRGLGDQETGRNMKNLNSNGDSSQNATEANYVAMLQGIDETLNAHDVNTRTAQAALATPLQHSQYPDVPSSFDTSGIPSEFKDYSSQDVSSQQGTPSQAPSQPMAPGAQALYDARQQQNKPAVGSNAWHQQRKDNHKEVERRRREVINEGIENIAKIVPGTEKNKGAILQRTHQYVLELQQKVASFENERAVFNVTQQELTSRIERLRDSAQRAWTETAKWQQRCRDAGLQFDDYDAGPGTELDDDPSLDPSVLPS